MPFILLIILMIFTQMPLQSQELKNQTNQTNQSKTNTLITAPYFSVFTKLNGISYVSQNSVFSGNTQGLSITGIEFTLGRKIFFYYQLGYLTSFSERIHSVNWGHGGMVSIGAGGHLLDFLDKQTSLGSLLSIKAGLGFMFLFQTHPNTQIPAAPFGLDVMLDYSYFFYKNVGIKVGMNLSFYNAALKSSVNPFDVKTLSGLAIIYGINFGFIF